MDGQLVLPEGADARIEALLRSQACPIHIHTTLAADGRCDMCEAPKRSKPRTRRSR